MTWRVIFARSAEKDLKSLSADVRSRVGRAIRRLEQDAFLPAIKRLKGREEFRMRVGDYRVLYVVSSEVVTIVAIGHRRYRLPDYRTSIAVLRVLDRSAS